MAVGTYRAFIESRGGGGRKTSVELRHLRVTAVTQGADLLDVEHVAVRTAVRLMAGTTAIDPRSGMFEYKGTLHIGMAVAAYRLFETTQFHAQTRIVRIVAGRAGYSALRQPVSLIERELSEGFLVTLKTEAGSGSQVSNVRRQSYGITWKTFFLSVYGVATRTGDAGGSMSITLCRVGLGMTTGAGTILLCRRLVTESTDGCSGRRCQMRRAITVAARAGNARLAVWH